MRLCFIADARSTHTQRWVRHFSTAHEVHLITYEPSVDPIPGVIQHVVPSRFRNLYLAFWPRHVEIRRLVTTIDPDLVHAHFITKYGFHLPVQKGWPTIVSAWGDDILILPSRSWLLFTFTRRILERVDLVYAVSRDIARHIQLGFGIPDEKVRWMPFGVDTTQFAPDPGSEKRGGGPVIVFSNRLYLPTYDHETLLEGFALARAGEPALRLVLKGEGPDEERLRRRAESLGLSDAVRFHGRTPLDRVPEDLRAADIFVSTALSDGTPVSMLEAMATGLPCICTAVGGVPEWIRNGENGVLIPPRAPEALAEAILALAADPLLRKRLGARARETVRERADWGRLMVQVEDDYKELINNAGGRR